MATANASHQLPEWSHATYIWKHDLGVEHIPFEQQTQPTEDENQMTDEVGSIGQHARNLSVPGIARNSHPR